MQVADAKVPDMTTEERLANMVSVWQLPLLRTCSVLLGDLDMAKDAVQETFFKAYKALPSFRGECSEKTWLMRIAMNVCRDMKRSSWFRIIDRHTTLEDLPEPIFNPQELESDMMTALLALSHRDQQILLLHYYHNMTLTEIAGVIGISQPAVSKRLKKAQERLKALMKEGET